MKHPKVSIVILDFLKASRVVENVESILKQRAAFQFEIIIVDNSCNEKNAETLQQLEKEI
jgi:glycosyltransferase involved in cell wall biosynthesis